MSKAEVIAYNYGRQLAQDALRAVQDGRGGDFVPSCILDTDQLNAVNRLGQQGWLAWVQKGGQSILGEADVVPPLPT